jgi:ribosomal protein S18 acetylase RimI-like enzyme
VGADGGMRGGLRLRPARPEDDAFLRRVYAGTRAEELALVDWTEAQKQAFVAMQFEAQDRHYRAHFGGARFDVIERDGVAVGRLYVDRTAGEIRVLDISLLPEHRGAGIGSALLGALVREAGERGEPITIHVERMNPARRLYERLGFREVGDEGVYLRLEWRPEAQAKTAS